MTATLSPQCKALDCGDCKKSGCPCTANDHPNHPVPEEVPVDLAEGRRRRDEGMARVIANTPDEYREMFDTTVGDFEGQRFDFVSENVTDIIGFPPAGTHPNTVGALTRAMAVKHGAVKVDRRQAQRANQHASEITVWGWR